MSEDFPEVPDHRQQQANPYTGPYRYPAPCAPDC